MVERGHFARVDGAVRTAWRPSVPRWWSRPVPRRRARRGILSPAADRRRSSMSPDVVSASETTGVPAKPVRDPVSAVGDQLRQPESGPCFCSSSGKRSNTSASAYAVCASLAMLPSGRCIRGQTPRQPRRRTSVYATRRRTCPDAGRHREVPGGPGEVGRCHQVLVGHGGGGVFRRGRRVKPVAELESAVPETALTGQSSAGPPSALALSYWSAEDPGCHRNADGGPTGSAPRRLPRRRPGGWASTSFRPG